jgi:hypothetical protein
MVLGGIPIASEACLGTAQKRVPDGDRVDHPGRTATPAGRYGVSPILRGDPYLRPDFG